MKRLVMLVALCGSLTACSSVAPEPGQEAVLVYKPLIWGHGGVDDSPIKTGMSYTAISTSAVYVNMQPRQQQFEFNDLFTNDGVPLDFHAAVQYQIVDSVKLVKDFGADDSAQGMGFFIRTLDMPFRMMVRDAVKKHGLNEMAINVTAAQQVDDEISARLAEEVKRTGVPIKILSVTLGRANPPDAIKHQRIATAEQEQRVNTEKQGKLAEDQRKMHEQSRAEADNAYREAMHLSPEQFVQLKQIEAFTQVCAYQRGNCTFISGNGTPMFTIK